ncbi:MAG: hypothetical protein CMG59_05090 [Candidatus Marinimicrobia bacterium]|nr:hypothetical protein [Candidatus Neomarinimicrobiota bacterium]|tara:strand:+ start:442 stop:1017 length:576 start_codon:yes stop_codon:yes gene_type:complete
MRIDITSGHTLIETMTALVISSIISIGMYLVFTNGSKNIQMEEILFDVKNYSTSCLELISDKMRSADNISINNVLGSSTITVETSANGESETYIYSIINNRIYENSIPLKIYGESLFVNEADSFDITISLACNESELSVFESSVPNLMSSIYDIDINVLIESLENPNYQKNYKSSKRIFAINKFVLNLESS